MLKITTNFVKGTQNVEINRLVVTCWGWNRPEVVVVGGWRTRAVVPSPYDRRRRREEAPGRRSTR
jgi:hypothetical protein